LAYLLATGSPAVPPLRSFSQEDIPNVSISQQHETEVLSATINKNALAHTTIVIVEMMLASAATAPVTYTCYNLGIKSILVRSADIYWHSLLWTSLTGLVYLRGTVVLRQLVRVVGLRDMDDSSIREELTA
jgi:hypothetical protein